MTRAYRRSQTGTCEVPDCERPHYSHGMCKLHVQRWQKHGDPSIRFPKRTPARCQVEGCDQPTRGKGYCEAHYWRWRDHRDPLWEPKPKGIQTYTSMHRMVRQQRGTATTHPCTRCSGPAEQWAYDHADPDERYELDQGPYSLDINRYIPMCGHCHTEFDRGVAKVS